MYSKLEIDRNLKMLRKCTDECLAKLAETTNPANVNLLEQRIETTLTLADFFVDSLKSQSDEDDYIKSVFEEISNCNERYEKYKNSKMIKQVAMQIEERLLTGVHEEMTYSPA